MKKQIFLSSPHMSDEGYEQKFIKEAFDTNWIAPLGNNVNQFEHEMAIKLDAKEAVALSSGTAALHLALKLINIKRGDIVFCPSLTFAASANPILYEGAIPVFIDSDIKTWNICPIALERAFKKYFELGKMPKALILVHLYGMMADLDEIISICNKYNCKIIEDAAEALGSKYKNKYAGTFGDYGIISFNGNKIITSSGGGMLLCNGQDALENAKKAKFLATQSRENARWYQHKEIGYNYRMSNVLAGIGRGQLRVLDEHVNKKQYIYGYYKESFKNLKGLSLEPQYDWENSNCWLTVIQLEENSGVQPIELILALEQENIESRFVWKPLHLQPLYNDSDFITNMSDVQKTTVRELESDNSIAGNIFRKGVCLPSDTKMDDEDLDRVCKIVAGLWK